MSDSDLVTSFAELIVYMCQDWKAHKPFCKTDEEIETERPPAPPVDGAPTLDAENMAGLDDIGLHDIAVDYQGPVRAIDISVPGEGSIRLESKHLTPEMMRWMRETAGKGPEL